MPEYMMAENRSPVTPGDVIGVLLGAPFFILLSPLLLLAAIVGLFSSNRESPRPSLGPTQFGTQSTGEPPEAPMSKGAFLFIAICFWAFLVTVYVLRSSGESVSPSPRAGVYVDPLRLQTQDEPVWVNGYFRSDGTYVPGHYRTKADADASNSWSSYPNVNPYTGKPGTRHMDGK
jgi:hypothetical protein